jgi:hypothetical protein
VATVRRRIRAGSLEAELVPGRGGTEYRVRLPGEYPPDQAEPPQLAQEPTQTTAVLLGLLEHQAADLCQRDERIERLHADLLAEGKAAVEWRTGAELLEAEVERQRAELARVRWPWWRRWFRG